MKNKAIRVAPRAVIVIVLGISLITYPCLSGSSSSAATAPAIDIKTESQYRNEATLYDRTIREIASIASMKLDSEAGLKQAIAILDRARPNMKLITSKLITMAFSDSTFSAGVKKKSPDKQAAEAFVKELSRDTKSVLKLEGAQSLSTRIRNAITTDAEILKRSAARLNDAAARIKQSGPRGAAHDLRERDDFKMGRVGFRPPPNRATEPAPSIMAADPATVFAIIFVAVVVIEVVILGPAVIRNIVTEEGRDKTADCLEGADSRLASCNARADRDFPPSGLTFLVNLGARALCYETWLIQVALCYTSIN